MAASQPSRRSLILPAWVLVGIAGGIAFGTMSGDLQMGAPLIILGLGGMALMLTGYAGFRLFDPLLRREVQLEAPDDPGRLRDLEREKQLVLKAIKEIELDFQMKKISETDHRDLVRRYRTRAMRIIAQLEAGDDYRSLIEQELKHRLGAIGKSTRPEQADKDETVK